MKMKIDKYGYLAIQRGKKMKIAECPKCEFEYNCGDHCAHFGEPEFGDGEVCIETCGKMLYCEPGDFEDER